MNCISIWYRDDIGVKMCRINKRKKTYNKTQLVGWWKIGRGKWSNGFKGH